MRTPFRVSLIVLVALALAACTGPGAASPTTEPPSAAPSAAESATAGATGSASPSAPASAAPSVSAECQKDSLDTLTAGQLTIGTDNPAFPPWFGGDPATSEASFGDVAWEVSDPYSGEGYESATAYAIAEKLGFAEDDVRWVYVPFDTSFAPGEKDFDFDINQISYSDERAESVDFSDSYYDVNQAVVANADTDIAAATSVSDLKAFKLGAPLGTTSYQYIVDNIQPEQEPAVFNTQAEAITGLQNGNVDGLVVDLPTAFYIVAAELDNGTIVGQLPTVGEQEYFGVVLEKDSPLTDCVNEAIAVLRADGSLEQFKEQYLDEGAPVLDEG